jgi:predicted outer membrane repeat protein
MRSRVHSSKHGGVGAHIAAWVLTGAMCLLVWPSLAAASSYHDFLCRIPYGPSAGRAAPTDDVSYSTNGDFVFAGDSCASGGALYASMDGEVPHPYSAGGYDTFTAPACLTISSFTVWRYEADGPSQPFGSPASNLDYNPGPASVQGLCSAGHPALRSTHRCRQPLPRHHRTHDLRAASQRLRGLPLHPERE